MQKQPKSLRAATCTEVAMPQYASNFSLFMSFLFLNYKPEYFLPLYFRWSIQIISTYLQGQIAITACRLPAIKLLQYDSTVFSALIQIERHNSSRYCKLAASFFFFFSIPYNHSFFLQRISRIIFIFQTIIPHVITY